MKIGHVRVPNWVGWAALVVGIILLRPAIWGLFFS
jgi:hypothetical protein